MTSWEDFKSQLNSISKDEMIVIETMAKLNAERIKQGISQKDFAQQIGMSQPQLAKIEHLDSMPSLATLNRYAHGLGLEIKLSLEPV